MTKVSAGHQGKHPACKIILKIPLLHENQKKLATVLTVYHTGAQLTKFVNKDCHDVSHLRRQM